ncbi:unnamed protein product [Orchesella dallaii]|uniref:Uncharacterized protein n=1 Tax=Orchesella dallaii TaxID=48710 RepID=A0ABP1RDY9_9HEXA
MDPYSSVGTITLEYYDGSSDFSESDDDSGNSCCYLPPDTGQTYSSTSIPETREAASFKTYDFKHPDTEKEFTDTEAEVWLKQPGNSIRKLFSENAKEAMDSHYEISHEEQMNNLFHPKASFPRCPRGGLADNYNRRSYAGPFLTCPINHECGDEFHKIPISTKPIPEFDPKERPPQFREKRARLHSTHMKVWPQHLADLKHVLEQNLEEIDDSLSELCENYRPSTVMSHATRYSVIVRRKRPDHVLCFHHKPKVIMKRRTTAVRVIRTRRSLQKTNSSEVSDSRKLRPNTPEQDEHSPLSQVNTKKFVVRQSKTHNNASGKTLWIGSNNKTIETQELFELSNVNALSESSSSEIDTTKARNRLAASLRQRLSAPVTRAINSRQASSRVSKRFVRKPQPPKEAKYIQKLKPNISAKFLQARSKNRIISNSNTNTPRNQQVKSKRDVPSITKIFKRSRRNSLSKNISPRNQYHGSSDEDESYAKFRDHNGKFDEEKYRQSILKMLVKSENNTVRERKKKKGSQRQVGRNFVGLPKIKNHYSNVKPKITSNIPQRKRRKRRKPKSDIHFDFSDFSLKSKFSSDTVLDAKDSYFSVPSLDI